MNRYVIADFRMKDVYRKYIESLGYEIINSNFNSNLYDEIAGHVDISYVKIGNDIIVSPDKHVELSKKIKCLVGKLEVLAKYPYDIPYNVCIMGKKAIHNFKYTDPTLKEFLIKLGYELIDVNQGYANCAIAPIDDNSCITSDIGLAKKLLDYGIDVLYANEPDIKLLKRTNREETNQKRMFFEYSDMQGFIGGAMAKIGDEIILFGDEKKLLNRDKIVKFIESKGKKLRSFEGEEIIDYGSIIVID